jgi:hypothetical protein
MAVFAAAFTVAQSSDCTTLTFTDTSNYNTVSSPTANDNGIAVSSFTSATGRQFIISDSNYDVISTLSMTGGALTANFALTSDSWLSVDLNLIQSPSQYTVNHSVLSTCFLTQCFAELVSETDCGCGCNTSNCNCDSVNSDKTRLIQIIKAAEIFAEYSNPPLAQKQLDAGTAICQANESTNS